MAVEHQADDAISRLAAAIGEPARARMLYCLMDNHARTSTELAVVAGVSPSTASVHLNRLKVARLVQVVAQGKHRYYRLAGPEVATVLESLNVLAGGSFKQFVPSTPHRLRAARTCYDHLAGTLGVLLHDRFLALGWVVAKKTGRDQSYALSSQCAKALEVIGLDLAEMQNPRRRLAFACLDWSERRFHLGGLVGAALLRFMLKRKWVTQDLDGRAVVVTPFGRRELQARFGLTV